MKYFEVSFEFKIPVAVNIEDSTSENEEESRIEAYYAAKEEFSNFNINEANIKVYPISEKEYQSGRELINTLHRNH